MNEEDIIRMAREAGWHDDLLGVSFTAPLLERFAALVAEREREACAKVCEEEFPGKPGYEIYAEEAAQVCAAAIRARGEV